MELDNKFVDKLSAIGNDELRKNIENVAKSMGADTKILNMYLKDMEKVKKTLSEITQSDLDKITNAIGEDKTSEIIESLKKEVN